MRTPTFVVAFAVSLLAGASASSQAGEPVATPAADAIAAVWSLEEAYWRYVKAGDVENYVTLWHDDFIGWPCGQAHPKRKDSIGDWVREVRDKRINVDYALTREGDQGFGDVVVVHYSFTRVDTYPDGRVEGRGNRSKITHTWKRVGETWQIIGGMCGNVAGAAPPAGHQPGDETAILALLDRYMVAISTRDLAALAAMQMHDGMTYVARPKQGDRAATEIVGRPNSYWVNPSQASGPPLRERYWSPTLLVRGSIALAWAPYEFWEDGKTSHCGVDTFDLVKVDGQWRVANAMWTVEPDACAAMRPTDASAVRPED